MRSPTFRTRRGFLTFGYNTLSNLEDFIDAMREEHPAVLFENLPDQGDTTQIFGPMVLLKFIFKTPND